MQALWYICYATIFASLCEGNPRLSRRNGPVNRAVSGNTDLTDFLWANTSSLRQAALQTEFIQGIQSGTLDPTAFGRFMLQDAVWCEAAGMSMARAAERISPTNSDVFAIRAFLWDKANSYKGYGEGIYADWQVNDSSGILLNGGCRAYSEYEYEVADTMDYGYFLICMLPCVKLWPWLGQQLMSSNSTFGAYTDWVHYNLDPTYTGYTKIEDMVNMVYEKGLLEKATALTVFSNCMMGEVSFFEYAT